MYSTRGFKTDPVPQEEVLTVSLLSASPVTEVARELAAGVGVIDDEGEERTEVDDICGKQEGKELECIFHRDGFSPNRHLTSPKLNAYTASESYALRLESGYLTHLNLHTACSASSVVCL